MAWTAWAWGAAFADARGSGRSTARSTTPSIPWGWTIDRLVDSGDRLAVRGDFVGYGRGSGVKTELTSGGTVMELSSRGKIARQEWFVEQNGWKQALEAAGLSE
jgi:hypothetical protein